MEGRQALLLSCPDCCHEIGFRRRENRKNLSTQLGPLLLKTIFAKRLADNGQIVDLNSFLDISLRQEGWFLTSATSINDSGQILAQMFNPQLREGRQALLTPVPEPETYAMLLAGLGLLGFTTRKRKQPAKVQPS